MKLGDKITYDSRRDSCGLLRVGHSYELLEIIPATGDCFPQSVVIRMPNGKKLECHSSRFREFRQ